VVTTNPDPRRFDHEEAARLYKAGLGTPTLAERYGVSTGSMQKALRRQGVVMRSNADNRRFDHDEALALYKDGVSIPELARRFRVRRNSMQYALERAGVTIESRVRAQWWGEAVALHEAGEPHRDIAKRFGVQPQSVSYALREMGVVVTRPQSSHNSGATEVGPWLGPDPALEGFAADDPMRDWL